FIRAGRAVAFQPGSIEAWYTLGLALYRAGKWDDAVAALRGVPSSRVRTGLYPLFRNLAYPGLVLAMAHAKRGDSDSARSWYRRSIAWMTDADSREPVLLRLRAEAEGCVGAVPPATADEALRDRESAAADLRYVLEIYEKASAEPVEESETRDSRLNSELAR